MTTSYLCVLLLFFVNCGNSYKILIPFPTVSASHFYAIVPLLNGLTEKGHNVTAITTFPSKIKSENFRQIILPPFTQHTGGSHGINLYGNSFLNFKMYSNLLKTKVDELGNMLLDLNVQTLMREEKFDLVIVEGFLGYAALGLGAHFQCPTIMFASSRSFISLERLMKNPPAVSYVAHYFVGLREPLNFVDRILNMLGYFLELYYMDIHNHKLQKQLYLKLFPSPVYPVYEDMLQNVSLVFVSRHFSEGGVRPNVPGIIEISGIQIQNTSTPVSISLQKWMDESKDGFIYFSFGTNFNISSLPTATIKNMNVAFSKLSQNVLWKFENDTIPGMSYNIRIEKWLPQAKVLQHTNIKLFITHGGLGSITEALNCGVPLIVVPMRSDQNANANFVEYRGWGIQLPFSEINGEELSKSITKVLENSKYAEKAKYYSVLYRDRQNSPLDTAIYWVEYVIRHRGAKHLQSNAKYLNFFQLYSLDVIGFLVLVFGLMVLIICKFIYFILHQLRKNNKHKSEYLSFYYLYVCCMVVVVAGLFRCFCK